MFELAGALMGGFCHCVERSRLRQVCKGGTSQSPLLLGEGKGAPPTPVPGAASYLCCPLPGAHDPQETPLWLQVADTALSCSHAVQGRNTFWLNNPRPNELEEEFSENNDSR